MPTGIYKRNPFSEEHKKNIGVSLRGKKRTYRWTLLPETRKRQGLTKIGNKYRLGTKNSKETRQKISLSNSMEKHWNWKVDRTQLKKFDDVSKDRRSSAYVTWRKEVWLRDNFKCKIANPDCLGRIEAHHILGWSEYPELRYDRNNGITLCHFHHPKVRKEEKRLSPYFQSLVSVSKE